MKEFNEFGEPVEAPKKKKFGFFASYAKDGKGIKKEAPITDYNIKNFFKLYTRRFVKMIWVNALYIMGNFPFIFFLLALSGIFSTPGVAPASEMFPVLNGIRTAAGGFSPSMSVLAGIHGGMSAIYANTLMTNILYVLSGLFILTWGPVNAGCTYIIKNMIKGEPIFMWQDFIGTIKTNWKQALPMGILDLITIGVSAYSLYMYYVNYEYYYVMFYAMVLVAIIYSFMRTYIYTIMVTFELNFFKIIKNAAIFSILGFGRNFMMFCCCVILVALTIWLGTIFVPLMVISIFMILFSNCAFFSMYAVYPKIKKYMIDPYYSKSEQEEDYE